MLSLEGLWSVWQLSPTIVECTMGFQDGLSGAIFGCSLEISIIVQGYATVYKRFAVAE